MGIMIAGIVGFAAYPFVVFLYKKLFGMTKKTSKDW